MLRTISERTKKIPQVNERNKCPTIYRQAHPQRSQNEGERCSHGMD